MKLSAVTLILMVSVLWAADAQAYFVYVQAGGPKRVSSPTEQPAQSEEDESESAATDDLSAPDGAQDLQDEDE